MGGVTTSGVDALGLLEHLEEKKQASKKASAEVSKDIRNARKVVKRMKDKACTLSNKELLEVMHMRMEKQKKDLARSNTYCPSTQNVTH